jgi:hypothetical protein
MRVHGGFGLRGTDTEIHNLELEHLSVDPSVPDVGLIWYNVVLGKISYVEALDGLGNPIIRRVSSDSDVSAIIAKIVESSQSPVVNSTTNNLLFGHPVYGISGTEVELACANDINKKEVIGLVTDTILANGGGGKLQLFGKITGSEAQWGMVVDGGLVPNTKYFLDAVAGKLKSTVPVGTGLYLCPIGRALSTTEFVIKIEQPIAL